jgi:hypothetical protein
MKGPFFAITTRTNDEWPADHPLRQHAAAVLSEKFIEETLPQTLAPGEIDVLVCQLKSEPRNPPPQGDCDVVTQCAYDCGRTIIHRGSAPRNLKPVCYICFQDAVSKENP